MRETWSHDVNVTFGPCKSNQILNFLHEKATNSQLDDLKTSITGVRADHSHSQILFNSLTIPKRTGECDSQPLRRKNGLQQHDFFYYITSTPLVPTITKGDDVEWR